jgi:ubiquitin-protein ligase
MNKSIKRIINKDIKSIEHNKLNEAGIFIEFNEENMLSARAMIIGPKDSIYEGGFLFFYINFPKNYPYSPPDVAYVPVNKIRIHPNLYASNHKSGYGKVCLSILGTWNGPQWTTVMDISAVLLSIQSILDKYPLLNEPGYTFSEKKHHKIIYDFDDVAFSETISSLIIKNYDRTPEDFNIFKSIMTDYIKNNFSNIAANITKRLNIKNRNVVQELYRLNYPIDNNELLKEYLLFCSRHNL